jgi:hypothetical protein
LVGLVVAGEGGMGEVMAGSCAVVPGSEQAARPRTSPVAASAVVSVRIMGLGSFVSIVSPSPREV